MTVFSVIITEVTREVLDGFSCSHGDYAEAFFSATSGCGFRFSFNLAANAFAAGSERYQEARSNKARCLLHQINHWGSYVTVTFLPIQDGAVGNYCSVVIPGAPLSLMLHMQNKKHHPA